MRIGKPAADGHGMLGVEDVRCGRVVDDDGVLQVTSDLREVFDVVSLVVVAALAEQPVVDNLVDVELIKERIAILLEPGQHVHGRGTTRAPCYIP